MDFRLFREKAAVSVQEIFPEFFSCRQWLLRNARNPELPENAWHQLCIIWIVYFVSMAVLNAYVAVAFDTNTWVNFKLGSVGLLLLFAVGQGIFIARHWKKEPPPAP